MYRGRRTVVAAGAIAVLLSIGSGHTTVREAPEGPDAVDIEDLAWIAGHWGGEAFGGEVEESWLAPKGRGMSGLFRLVQNDIATMYELIALEQDEDGEIYYRFKHVGRGWEPWEETPLEYRLTELEGTKATFRSTADSPQPNAPWWFTYERTSDDQLLVSIHGASGGAPLVLRMRRL